jgi:2-polyprenyl-3-methyl-5-hydroxy-6-metoxy-1,4-benzoquinol methylase
MDADKYFDHWQGKKIWTHLKWLKHQERFRTIARHLEGIRIADVGCATGHSTEELRTLYPQAAWEGIDFSTRIIKAALQFFPKGTWHYSPDFRIRERFGTYDTLVCSEVLEHVEDDADLARALLEAASRRVVITTPCIRVSDPGHLRVYTEEKLKSLFTMAKESLIFKQGAFFYLIAKVRK